MGEKKLSLEELLESIERAVDALEEDNPEHAGIMGFCRDVVMINIPKERFYDVIDKLYCLLEYCEELEEKYVPLYASLQRHAIKELLKLLTIMRDKGVRFFPKSECQKQGCINRNSGYFCPRQSTLEARFMVPKGEIIVCCCDDLSCMLLAAQMASC